MRRDITSLIGLVPCLRGHRSISLIYSLLHKLKIGLSFHFEALSTRERTSRRVNNTQTFNSLFLNTDAIILFVITSDPPQLRTGAMLILKCFSTISCM
jgi:hypothetical protein